MLRRHVFVMCMRVQNKPFFFTGWIPYRRGTALFEIVGASARTPPYGGGENFVRGQIHGENFAFQFGDKIFPAKVFLHNLGNFLLFVHPQWRQ